jgi:outer membrane protein
MNSKSLVLAVLLSVVLIVGGLFTYHKAFREKIGYVKTGYIISEYKGMILANEQFDKEIKQVQTNLDTLRLRYEHLQAGEKNIPSAKREELAYQLGMARAEYEKYNQQAGQQMESRKQQLTGKVLEEINAFIQDYGKKEGYRYILGTTESGSILYAGESDDITSTILKALNDKFPSADGANKGEEMKNEPAKK